MDDTPEIVSAGKYLRLMRKGKWEYVDRTGTGGAVGIVAITDDAKLLLVEQYRAPVDKYVIELPAGLVGDEPGQERESVLVAARRELQEETGYDAGEISFLVSGPTSPGMNSEIIALVLAGKLQKLHAGGGVEGESIVIHEIPLTQVEIQLKEWIAQGKLVDLKVYAGLHFAGI
ncbi:MAG TPA: NUDIX hydrolase [Humisphaera sp.]|nr:NUDIX hydrolase [Humisphaera sp.]